MATSHRYTHGHAESVLRSHRTRTAENSAAYLLPQLRAGQRLLDVGSGPGTITVDLAERIAPGRVTALETTKERWRTPVRRSSAAGARRSTTPSATPTPSSSRRTASTSYTRTRCCNTWPTP